MIYAGFWRRFAALTLDMVVLALCSIPISFFVIAITPPDEAETTALPNFFGLLLSWFYFAHSESSGHQATVGKRVLGIKVTDQNGEAIGFGRASARHFSKIISGVLLFIGYLMSAFTPRKQALHDMIAGCLVVCSNSNAHTSQEHPKLLCSGQASTLPPMLAVAQSEPISPEPHLGADSYALVARELEEGNYDQALWLKCFSEADGDESKANARYNRERAMALTEAARLTQALCDEREKGRTLLSLVQESADGAKAASQRAPGFDAGSKPPQKVTRRSEKPQRAAQQSPNGGSHLPPAPQPERRQTSGTGSPILVELVKAIWFMVLLAMIAVAGLVLALIVLSL